jgi:hypothetical protein
VCYNADNEYLIIRLKSVGYHYCAIGADVVAALLSADSMGRFYNKHIKDNAPNGRYSCQNHPVPTFQIFTLQIKNAILTQDTRIHSHKCLRGAL